MGGKSNNIKNPFEGNRLVNLLIKELELENDE